MLKLGVISAQNYPRTFTLDYLVVAGGGSGGGARGKFKNKRGT